MKLVSKFAGWIVLFVASHVVAQDQQAKQTTSKEPAPQKLQIARIENTYKLSSNLYSGGDPHGLEALTALQKLGIKTIISVDGVAPDIEAARKLGMRYVHLPIGYDGVPRSQAVRMVKAVKSLPGPIYVHCHHGTHRGPAAAAVCEIAVEGWTNERAVDWLKIAGTSADYLGLYTSAREFTVPTADELARAGDTFPEQSKVADLVELMVKVDERWDRLKAAQKLGFPAANQNRDDALQLVELFRESARLPESKEKGSAFQREMATAERAAIGFHESLTKTDGPKVVDSSKTLEAAFNAVGKSCKACHARYRDN